MSKNINIILTLLVFSNCLQKPPVIVEDPIQIDEVKLESKDKIKTEPNENVKAIAHFMDGQLFMSQGNYSMAILEFQDALELDPMASTIIVSMAESYWKLGKARKSEELLFNALNLNPDDFEAREMLANQYIFQNKHDKAIEQYRVLAEISDEDPRYLIALAKLVLSQNNINESISLFIKAYEKDKSRIDILEEAANLSLRSRQLDKARSLYKQLIDFDKNNAYYLSTYIDLIVMSGDYINGINALESLIDIEGETAERLSQLGILYYKMENIVKAKPLFIKLINMNHFDVTIMHFLSNIYLEESILDSAGIIANQIIFHHPSDPRGYLDAALAELNNENPLGAIKILEPVNKKFFNEFSIQYLLGSSYQQLEEYDKATIVLRQSLKIYPESRGARHTLAIASDALNYWNESDSLYEGLIASDTNDVQALNNYSYSLVERNIHLNKALEMAKKAIELEPDNAAYLDTIGWIYYKMENIDKALSFIRKSVELDNNNAIVLEHLGDVLIAKNQIQEAIIYYLKALDIDKDNEILQQKAGIVAN
ncbi:MAG: tetratricopeptide repeat protein [Candidatus Neomarinimicrobiota bacterium]|nr:tetratricopeptide repeat protein [Candidatus Neomarinimicrobiota bacterium]